MAWRYWPAPASWRAATSSSRVSLRIPPVMRVAHPACTGPLRHQHAGAHGEHRHQRPPPGHGGSSSAAAGAAPGGCDVRRWPGWRPPPAPCSRPRARRSRRRRHRRPRARRRGRATTATGSRAPRRGPPADPDRAAASVAAGPDPESPRLGRRGAPAAGPRGRRGRWVARPEPLRRAVAAPAWAARALVPLAGSSPVLVGGHRPLPCSGSSALDHERLLDQRPGRPRWRARRRGRCQRRKSMTSTAPEITRAMTGMIHTRLLTPVDAGSAGCSGRSAAT